MQINADDGTTFVLRGEHYLLKIEKRSIKGIWCEIKYGTLNINSVITC